MFCERAQLANGFRPSQAISGRTFMPVHCAKCGIANEDTMSFCQHCGMQLPQRLNLDGSYQGTLFQMELAFSGYKVKVL